MPSIGEWNAKFVRDFLALEGIPLVAERMGGNHAVHLYLQTDTGKATVHTVDGSILPKIIAAEGEQLSAAKLGEAADIIAQHPIALQLRNLQVLADVAGEHNSTIIFPAQFMDTMQPTLLIARECGQTLHTTSGAVEFGVT